MARGKGNTKAERAATYERIREVLSDPAWSERSNAEVATAAETTGPTVARVRVSLGLPRLGGTVNHSWTAPEHEARKPPIDAALRADPTRTNADIARELGEVSSFVKIRRKKLGLRPADRSWNGDPHGDKHRRVDAALLADPTASAPSLAGELGVSVGLVIRRRGLLGISAPPRPRAAPRPRREPVERRSTRGSEVHTPYVPKARPSRTVASSVPALHVPDDLPGGLVVLHSAHSAAAELAGLCGGLLPHSTVVQDGLGGAGTAMASVSIIRHGRPLSRLVWDGGPRSLAQAAHQLCKSATVDPATAFQGLRDLKLELGLDPDRKCNPKLRTAHDVETLDNSVLATLDGKEEGTGGAAPDPAGARDS